METEDFLGSYKGLRQGDLLSSYLLVLEKEVLSILMDKTIRVSFCEGSWLNVEVGPRSPYLIYLANDTMVLCKDFEEQLVNLSWILLCCEFLSRLKVNLEKGIVFPIGLELGSY